MQTFDIGVKPLGYEQVVLDDATIKKLDVPAGTVRAVFGVEDEPIRYRDDGTDPSSSKGFLVKADETFQIVGPDPLDDFRVAKDDDNAKLNVIYYG